eukprot:CAMPEP_0203906318 /NCGR_PEP_ID=MMETSP0359-20131031/47960_1 /ASSEMBLY_ACC=CAM_ASM_000338 /TAXON_ID=268821 /ORGANISM="Scrippsiella Hangoei, Strain SHTV-5" /LENGTH=355 /DNA_ID=CAMNT_0050830939 /DNA_START=1 /DNA_END=1068 /DNA_ORIENTATION=-
MSRGMAFRCLQLQSLLVWIFLQPSRGWLQFQLLQWNPHWQCFVWNQNNCSTHVESQLNEWLEEYDVDFANAVEIVDSNYTTPKAWSVLRTSCGPDRVALIYNNLRWRALEGNGTFQSAGCMEEDDRPYIVQVFESLNSTLIGSNSSNSSERLVVVGAHFPHPAGPSLPLSADQTDGLKNSIAGVVNGSGEQRVILIADTNEYSIVPNTAIREYLRLPTLKTVGTDLENTCCFDYGFFMSFDRIITNFGGHMRTKVLMQPPLPNWAQQVQEVTFKRGAFHLPVLGTLFAQGDPGPGPGPGPVYPNHHSGFKTAFISIVSVLVLVMVGWFSHAAMSEKKKRDRLSMTEESQESDDSE